MKNKRNIILIVLLFAALSINAQTLTVEISNIRNNKGNIVLSVFYNNESFRKEEALFSNRYDKGDLKSDKMTCKIQLKSGSYGITILDDENVDGEMEFSIIGIPQEGYGFSNFYHKGITKPEFEDFDFIIGEKDKIVQVELKYLL
ncbi:MAG: DUF2141 domain-containing protein [Bacteroidales bacterium]|nr:DUF2141 domain-containing protein [Bacteroidales bacterium]